MGSEGAGPETLVVGRDRELLPGGAGLFALGSPAEGGFEARQASAAVKRDARRPATEDGCLLGVGKHNRCSGHVQAHAAW